MKMQYSTFIFAILVSVFSIAANAQTIPRPSHVVVVIEENKYDTSIIGNLSAAPYINAIANDSNAVLFSEAYAIFHPSQPNYLHLFSGDNQGVFNDNVPTGYPFTTPNLARELMDKGFTFAAYSQDLPSVGYDGANSNLYYRKHNPVTNWVGTGTNQVPDTLNRPFTDFPTDYNKLPTISFVVANEDSDMHNGGRDTAIRNGDFWFHSHLAGYIEWARTHNSLLIFTFDEDEGFNFNKPNNIATFFFGPMVKHGVDTNHMDLHDMLRTLEDMYGLDHAGNAATATPMTTCWKADYHYDGINNVNDINSYVSVFPNPANNFLKIEGIGLADGNYSVIITDVTGRIMDNINLPDSRKLEINTANYPAGLYFYRLNKGKQMLQSGKVIVTR